MPVLNIPEVSQGADVAALVLNAIRGQGITLTDGDIVVVSSKVISKAAGLRTEAAAKTVAVLEESRRVVAERRAGNGITRVVESLAGPVLAAAGIDASNTGATGTLLRLPRDPDTQARRLRADLIELTGGPQGGLTALGVVITDTAGRPWRVGQTDFALGAAGVMVVDDLGGTPDDDGVELQVTARAVADELAAAADLVKAKTTRIPAVLIRGLAQLTVLGPEQESASIGASRLIRSASYDWFALGHVEAIRAALGVPPGSAQAVEVGIPGVEPDGLEARLSRACALATHPDGLPEVPAGHPRHHVVQSRPRLEDVLAQVVQSGVRLLAVDPVALGLVIGRLLSALFAEGVPATLARIDPPRPGASHGRHTALVVLL
ncbi:MAG TPA: coenzyme F420-0:L-glutamate ligase [Dermatophilaceae bacterium]|nr:coenzyme F420-0:L-glutamate ligase [Dermatophilaceae bacterium]